MMVVTIDNREESTDSDTFTRTDAYALLTGYAREAQVYSLAHALSAQFYWDLGKFFNYPIIVLSAATSVLAGLRLNEYFVLGTSLTMLTLTSFDHALNPRGRANLHVTARIEFDEIAANVRQFMGTGQKRPIREVENMSDDILNYLNKWKSIGPTPPPRYLKRAKASREQRMRSHRRKNLRPIFDVVD